MLSERAQEALNWLEVREGKVYTTPGAPSWVTELARTAHGDLLPDDWCFQFLYDTLTLLAENPETDPEELLEQIEPDVLNARLLAWLGSNETRVGYVDEITGDLGHSETGILGDIAMGQLAERRDVFRRVVEFLGRLEMGA